MGIFDKLKNALFEEEYVEVEEKPKIKHVNKKKNEIFVEDNSNNYVDDEKPIAKKIIVPEKNVEEEENIEVTKEIVRNETDNKRPFQVIEDSDLTVDDKVEDVEPQIVKVIDRDSHPYGEGRNDNENLYHGRISNQPYGSLETPRNTVSDSRLYDKRKEDPTHFTPSPIISPIYGVLDKNYKKDDVVAKREVTFTSSYAKERLNFDDVRKKAYGDKKNNKKDEDNNLEISVKETQVKVNKPTFDVDCSANLLVDLSSDESKPSVKDVTLGDATEYFEDLGLEYNVDYLDANKKASGRREKEHYEEEPVVKEDVKIKEENNTKKEELDNIDNENLFDLIDSMYQE